MVKKNNHAEKSFHLITDGADALLQALGTTLEPDLLVHALTHRSFAHENPGLPNNERLEFLGDAVLELVVTETIYAVHPDFSEGRLAKMRAKAVSEDSLSAIARTKLNLGSYILLGNGEADQGGANKNSILCDTVESLLGATFVAHGIDEARRVVHRLIDDTLAEVATEGPALDWKTSLTVLSHKLSIAEPTYRMEVGGEESKPEFTAHVMLEDGSCVATATGPSKRKAQLAAAEIAYNYLSSHKRSVRALAGSVGTTDTASISSVASAVSTAEATSATSTPTPTNTADVHSETLAEQK